MRDLLRFHTEARDNPEAQVREARSLLDLYAELSGDDPYGRLVQREAELVRGLPAWYLFHDQLADLNHPLYIREVVRWAEEAGLRYLTDAEREFKRARPEVRERLRTLSEDRVRMMQYEDFLLNRSFRCSLLVRAPRTPAPEPQHERIRDLRVSGLTRPEDGPLADLSSTAMVGYTTPEKKRFQAGAPVVKAALQVLSELWPGSTPFESLYLEARRRLGRTDEGDDEERNLLTNSVFEGFRAAFLQLTVQPERYATETSERPVAIPLARLQAASAETWITNAMHSEIKLGALSRRLLVHLDGRDRAALLDALIRDHGSGDLIIRTQDGEPVVALEVAQALLEEALDQHLEILTRFAMLAS